MTNRPALLSIPGQSPSLLVCPRDDAKVSFYLRGMRVHFYRKSSASGFTSYDFPGMQAAEVQQIVELLMRDAPWMGILTPAD